MGFAYSVNKRMENLSMTVNMRMVKKEGRYSTAHTRNRRLRDEGHLHVYVTNQYLGTLSTQVRNAGVLSFLH